MLSQQVIQLSTSTYNALIVIVQTKKNRNDHFFIDFCELNNLTKWENAYIDRDNFNSYDIRSESWVLASSSSRQFKKIHRLHYSRQCIFRIYHHAVRPKKCIRHISKDDHGNSGYIFTVPYFDNIIMYHIRCTVSRSPRSSVNKSLATSDSLLTFFCLTGRLRDYIHKCSELLYPLTEILKMKAKYRLTDETFDSFCRLKELVT